MNSREKTEFFVELLEEKKLTDIYAIDVSKLTSVVDVFIIATALNDRQAKAVVDVIEEKAEEKGLKVLGKEGEKDGKWILMDYSDIVIHIFTKDERAFYNLEKLWSEGRILKGE